jgi:hypothetical protein
MQDMSFPEQFFETFGTAFQSRPKLSRTETTSASQPCDRIWAPTSNNHARADLVEKRLTKNYSFQNYSTPARRPSVPEGPTHHRVTLGHPGRVSHVEEKKG